MVRRAPLTAEPFNDEAISSQAVEVLLFSRRLSSPPLW